MPEILLVDDDLELTELLAELLLLEGFNVTVVHNGQEALSLLKTQSFDLMLLDIMMPVLNGTETLKQLRKTSNMPVLMLSARDDDIDRVLGLELGADDYLPKPFNDRELVARIKAILRRSTGTEFSLLQILIQNPGVILSRELLNLEILGKTLTPYDRAIDMHISNLRKKLPEREDNLPWFKTLRGRGYLLVTGK